LVAARELIVELRALRRLVMRHPGEQRATPPRASSARATTTRTSGA
jgi:hypothetical protein